MVAILGSFDERLSALEAAMRPTQVKTHAFRKAHENIDATLKATEAVLAQFDVSRQVEPRVLEGPRRDLDAYLEAVDRLQGAVAFFDGNRAYKSAEAALAHARGLLHKGLAKLEDEFRTLLATNRC
eukprot:SM006238S19842  [mRNA]  locus=s6238:11:625:+ [translate_table: standard]